MSEKALRVVATGDMFITRRIAEDGYEGFEELSDCIKEHDVKFSNLEMTFHNQEGYPAAVSGGTWAMMEPEALDDVKRFVNKVISIHSYSIIFTITLSNQILRLKGITYMQSIEWNYDSYICIFLL